MKARLIKLSLRWLKFLSSNVCYDTKRERTMAAAQCKAAMQKLQRPTGYKSSTGQRERERSSTYINISHSECYLYKCEGDSQQCKHPTGSEQNYVLRKKGKGLLSHKPEK